MVSTFVQGQIVDFTILHTNDLHSYFDGVTQRDGAGISQRGVYARLASAIKTTKSEKLAAGEDFVMLLDAGDFYSGTLFHAIAPREEFEDFPEFDFFHDLQYDAITLGNHEFDAKDEGFKTMMQKIFKRKSQVALVSTNFKAPKDLPPVIKRSKLKEYRNEKGEVILKIGFLGALGPNGCKVSKGMRQDLSFIGFDDKKNKEQWRELYKSLKTEAHKLKQQGADIIILMLHGGGEEDEKIAKKVPEINVIIAGHTHQVYSKIVNKTFIAQAGHYGKHLGVLPFRWDGHELTLKKPVNHPDLIMDITDSIAADPIIEKKVEQYQMIIDQILKNEKLPKSNEVVFHSDEELPKEFEFNSKLGSFVTSKVKSSLNDKDKSIELYFTTLGLIRTGILPNHDYTTADIFKIMPLGFGDHYKLGTPTVSFYLNKGEIKKLVEFLLIYSSLDQKFMPVFSDSLEIETRRWGIPFINRISKLTLHGKDYDQWPELIHVATNSFVFKYISFVNEKSYGLVKLIPKNREGQRVETIKSYQGEFPELLNGLLKAAQ